MFLFKSNQIKFYDTSYVLLGDDFMEINVFNTAKQIASITIWDESICLDSLCLDKHSFNTKFLNRNYPDNLLENIIKFRPIYSGRNLEKNGILTTQKIIDNSVNIIYTINDREVYFRDIKNRIKIKMEKL
jgi:hypothetical protein